MSDSAAALFTGSPIILKPCPFCGAEVKERPAGTDEPFFSCSGEECMGPFTTAGTYEDALVQWNTRAAANHQAGPSGGLIELLEQVYKALQLLGDDALGYGNDGETFWPLRDELMAAVDKHLSAIRARTGADGKKNEREILIHAADIMDKHDPTNMLGPSLRCFAAERLS